MQHRPFLFQPSSHPLGVIAISVGRSLLIAQNLAGIAFSTRKHFNAALTFNSAAKCPQFNNTAARSQYLLPIARPEPIRPRCPLRLLHAYHNRGDGDRGDIN